MLVEGNITKLRKKQGQMRERKKSVNDETKIKDDARQTASWPTLGFDPSEPF